MAFHLGDQHVSRRNRVVTWANGSDDFDLMRCAAHHCGRIQQNEIAKAQRKKNLCRFFVASDSYSLK